MKTKKIKLLAISIGVLMSLTTLCITLVTTAMTQEKEDIPSFIEGDVIYEPVLTGENVNGVPTGWMAAPTAYTPWPNNNGSGGWLNYDEKNLKNSEISPEKFTFTENGLHVGMGQGDFNIILPELKDENDQPVVDYVYTMEFTRGTDEVPGDSFGFITDIEGGADFAGGTHFKVYDYNGYTTYYYGGHLRHSQESATNKMTWNPIGEKNTITVYHINGMNYYFVNDAYVCTMAEREWYGDDAIMNGIGICFTSTTNMDIHKIVVKELMAKGVSDNLTIPGADIRYCDVDGSVAGEKSQGLRFTASVDKTSDLYKSVVPEGDYNVSNENVKFGMLILPTDMLPTNGILTVDTPEVVDTVMTNISSQDSKNLTFRVSLLNIPQGQQDRAFSARVYVKTKNDDGTWEYTYSKETITRTYCGVANLFYEDNQDEKVRKRLNNIFKNCALYEGPNTETMTFALLSDFHYMEGVYMSSVADLESILDRANNASADFIMHAGDFSNHYAYSPELINAYLYNKYNLPALGVYGNHETEGIGNLNTMEYVTPLLNNCEVVWGTQDGKISTDGSVGYYYYEKNGFRIIGLDTNYFLMSDTKEWKHIPAGVANISDPTDISLGLGQEQLAWLENTLMDAAEKDIPCIVVSHIGFSGVRNSSGQHTEVRALFEKANDKQPGTVLMAISGHLHTNHIDMVDNVLYLDVNTTRNTGWHGSGTAHYGDKTFTQVQYDDEGNAIGTVETKLDDLGQGAHTWFSTDPLSAIVRVSSSGRISIEGTDSTWLYDIVPNLRIPHGEEPSILSGTFDVPLY